MGRMASGRHRSQAAAVVTGGRSILRGPPSPGAQLHLGLPLSDGVPLLSLSSWLLLKALGKGQNLAAQLFPGSSSFFYLVNIGYFPKIYAWVTSLLILAANP